jgi:hypothetical protein
MGFLTQEPSQPLETARPVLCSNKHSVRPPAGSDVEIVDAGRQLMVCFWMTTAPPAANCYDIFADRSLQIAERLAADPVEECEQRLEFTEA